MKISAVVSRCEHCSKLKLLVARVRSEFLDMKVCIDCATVAVALQRQYAGMVDGELEITLLPYEEIRFELH